MNNEHKSFEQLDREERARLTRMAEAGAFENAVPPTPGPWDVEEYGDGSIEVVGTEDLDGLTLARVSGRPHKATTRANARLMAAAPQLLKELRLLNVDESGEQKRNTPAWSAIAKATGR